MQTVSERLSMAKAAAEAADTAKGEAIPQYEKISCAIHSSRSLSQTAPASFYPHLQQHNWRHDQRWWTRLAKEFILSLTWALYLSSSCKEVSVPVPALTLARR